MDHVAALSEEDRVESFAGRSTFNVQLSTFNVHPQKGNCYHRNLDIRTALLCQATGCDTQATLIDVKFLTVGVPFILVDRE